MADVQNDARFFITQVGGRCLYYGIRVKTPISIRVLSAQSLYYKSPSHSKIKFFVFLKLFHCRTKP